MPSTKRYFSLREVADYFGVPTSQMRRWVRRFLVLPTHKRIRVPKEALSTLEAVYKGFYHQHLRGTALEKYVRAQSPKQPPSPYAILKEVQRRLDKLICYLDQTAPTE